MYHIPHFIRTNNNKKLNALVRCSRPPSGVSPDSLFFFSQKSFHFLSLLHFFAAHTFNCRVLIVLVCVIALLTLLLGITVCWCFRSFLPSSLQLFYVSMALTISCGGFYATIALFIVCCWFLILRIRCINLILGQLINDNPMSEEFLILPSNEKLLSQDIYYMNQRQPQQQQQQKQNEQFTSSSTQQHPGSNIKQTQMKWVWRKSAKGTTTTTPPAMQVSANRSLAKLWPLKIFGNNHDTNEWHHLNKFVNQFNLTDIKTIFRM